MSVPAAIRTSAEWEEEKKVKNKNKQKKKKKSVPEQKQKKKKKNSNNEESKAVNFDRDRESCVVFPDVWCGPGIGFSADAVGSVDCVVARRNNNVSGRGKIDNQRERERDREREKEKEVPHFSSFFFSFNFYKFEQLYDNVGNGFWCLSQFLVSLLVRIFITLPFHGFDCFSCYFVFDFS